MFLGFSENVTQFLELIFCKWLYDGDSALSYKVANFRVLCLIRSSTCNALIYKLNYLTVLIFINFWSIYYMNWGMHMFSSSILELPSVIKIQNLTNGYILLQITLPHNCLKT